MWWCPKRHTLFAVCVSLTLALLTPTKPNNSQKANNICIFLSEYSRLLLIILFLDCFAMARSSHSYRVLVFWMVEWIATNIYDAIKTTFIMYSYCVFCSDTTNSTDTWYPPSIHPTVHKHTQMAE